MSASAECISCCLRCVMQKEGSCGALAQRMLFSLIATGAVPGALARRRPPRRWPTWPLITAGSAARGLDQWVCCFSTDGGILILNTTFVQREFKERLKPAKIGRLLTTEACAGQRRSDEPDVPAATVTPRPRLCITCQTRLRRRSQRRFEASENAREGSDAGTAPQP